MASLASRVVGRIYQWLLKPSIRYAYLPMLLDVTEYNRKEAMLHTCMEYVAHAQVKGDYCEFGIWKGANLVRAYHLARYFNFLSDMRFFGFDSFEGIPSLTRNE